MKKILIVSFILLSTFSFSQQDELDYNKWSMELSAGQSKGLKPFTSGYFSADPTKYFNFSDISSYRLGSRYMLNDKFGFKLAVDYNSFKNQNGSGSLPFKSEMYSMSFSGVMNIGKLLDFQEFTSRFGLLISTGVSISQFTPKTGTYKDITEDNGGILIGLTPQFRISNRISLNANFDYLTNFRQHFNWDGRSLSANDNNLSGSMFVASLGINFYLGKSKLHADWYNSKTTVNTKETIDEEARTRLEDIEAMLSDVDKDGVPDYLDFENNTPSGVAVDSRGRFIDKNNNGIPDELESDKFTDSVSSSVENIDVIKNLIDKGYLNFYFPLNSSIPEEGSTSNLFALLKYLSVNPSANFDIFGYADKRGGSNLNTVLSEKRAKYVYDFLVNNGIDKSRLSYTGNGIDTTFSNNNSKLDYRLARRVSVKIRNN